MSVHEGHRQRMRRQLKTSGMDSLSDVQVLEVLLYYAIPRADTNPIAHRLLERFGSLSGVLEAAPDELLKIDCMGDDAAQLICLIPQLERRHFIDRSGKASILASLEPVVASFVGILAFGEPVSLMVFLGLGCILACVYVLR